MNKILFSMEKVMENHLMWSSEQSMKSNHFIMFIMIQQWYPKDKSWKVRTIKRTESWSFIRMINSWQTWSLWWTNLWFVGFMTTIQTVHHILLWKNSEWRVDRAHKIMELHQDVSFMENERQSGQLDDYQWSCHQINWTNNVLFQTNLQWRVDRAHKVRKLH